MSNAARCEDSPLKGSGVARGESMAVRNAVKIRLEAMAIAMPRVAAHPNRADFRGVLTLVDVASDRAPAGAKGHRVVLTRAAAERALPSLLGMALDFAPAFDRHEPQRKVGVITSADLVGGELRIGGFLYGRDFPEVIREVSRAATPGHLRASRALGRSGRRNSLGMSYEIADARVEDMKQSVWKLTEVMFTGAAILRRDRAAYQNTWIELA